MDEIRIPLNKFDLAGFIGRVVSFISQLGIGNPAPLTVIPVVDSNGLTPDLYENAVNRVPHDELVKENKTLYFPFSSSNTGEPVLCADGRKYTVPEAKDREMYEFTDLFMDASETVGFLIKVTDNQVSIQFAKQFTGNATAAASVQILKHVGQFEDGMKAFLETYISDDAAGNETRTSNREEVFI